MLDSDEDQALGVRLEGTSTGVIYTLCLFSANAAGEPGSSEMRVFPTHPRPMRNGVDIRETARGWGTDCPARKARDQLFLPAGCGLRHEQEHAGGVRGSAFEGGGACSGELDGQTCRVERREVLRRRRPPYDLALRELETLGLGTRGGDPSDPRAEAIFAKMERQGSIEESRGSPSSR